MAVQSDDVWLDNEQNFWFDRQEATFISTIKAIFGEFSKEGESRLFADIWLQNFELQTRTLKAFAA